MATRVPDVIVPRVNGGTQMNLISRTIAISLFVMLLAISDFAQTTEFTFQGSLQNSSVPANGNFDFEFALFDSLAGGVQLGPILARSSVPVVNGTFSVNLSFGAQFPGANRFLEIRVRQTGGGGFTTLSPRQAIGSSPYAIQSLNAANATTATNASQLGGVAAGQYVLTNDPRMSDARNPLSGSSNYIQNQNAGAQASSNFNISGNGTVGGTLYAVTMSAGTISAGTLNATSQINLDGIQAIKRSNLFTLAIGDANDSIDVAGTSSRFGTGTSNGFTDIGGYFNGIYGFGGSPNGNEYYPQLVGRYGRGTVQSPTPPLANDVLFSLAGSGRVGGGYSTSSLIRFVATENWTPTAFGSRIEFFSGTTGTTSGSQTMTLANNRVGIRTNDPGAELHIVSNSGNIVLGDAGCPAGSTAIGFNGAFNNCLNYSIRGDGTDLYFNRPTGGEVLFRENNGSTQMRLRPGGVLQLATLGTAGATAICRNASNDISSCSSSARYKDNINSFSSGLDLVRKLRPVSFNWKDGGMPDMGLVAEDVNEVEPLLTTTNAKGDVEGVKYDRVGVVLINAVKEQQAQIEAQARQIETQRAEIEALKALVCSQNPKAAICIPKK